MSQTGQNRSVRTRDQVIQLLTDLKDGFTHTATVPEIYDEIRDQVLAEARGAEEQRRKDAEGQEPVMWQKQHIDGTWSWTTCHAFHEANGTPTRGLYTRPANVAALEARVQELEKAATDAVALIRNGRPVLARSVLQRVTTDCAALTREGGE
ncbi:hypothetical protein [Gluconobacter oxydans]|uniref:hypothetical protein n=1 Tax=Gluconobacter oxydans TaxID=442 RepID=UPI003463DDA9